LIVIRDVLLVHVVAATDPGVTGTSRHTRPWRPPANSLRHSLRLRAESNVEFDCQFVFHFHGASGNADGRDSKLFLLKCGTPHISPVLGSHIYDHGTSDSVKRELTMDGQTIEADLLDSGGFEGDSRKARYIQDIRANHAILNLLSLIRRQLGINHFQTLRLNNESHSTSFFVDEPLRNWRLHLMIVPQSGECPSFRYVYDQLRIAGVNGSSLSECLYEAESNANYGKHPDAGLSRSHQCPPQRPPVLFQQKILASPRIARWQVASLADRHREHG
jgi:hypothetical protein